jgi:type I restriction enzyme R subunit
LDSLRQKQIDYEEFLMQIASVAKRVHLGTAADTPAAMNTPAKRALYNNLGKNESLALLIDETVHTVKQDDFRGNPAKERMVKAALLPLLGGNAAEVERIFHIIVMQTEY